LLQANDMIRDVPQNGWAQMIDRAQSVVTRHPEFAFGHDVLSVAYREAWESAAVPERAQLMKEAARREANLTLKLDPQDAGAYVVLSDLEAPNDYRSKEAILLRGMRLAKHPKQPLGALYSYEGWLLGNVGRLREALSSHMIAQATDEWGAPKTSQLARAYANNGNIAAAKNWIQKGVQIWPNHSGIRRTQRYIVGFYEQPADALAIFKRIDAQNPPVEDEGPIWRTFIEARSARDRRAITLAISKIREASARDRIPPEIGVVMIAELGDVRGAFDAANSLLDRQQPLEPWFLFTPVTQNLRQDSGFVALADRFGLINYWRETGKRPDFCTDPARRGECSPQLLATLK
jgi:tetratricopeptide (TPR) repeat protein